MSSTAPSSRFSRIPASVRAKSRPSLLSSVLVALPILLLSTSAALAQPASPPQRIRPESFDVSPPLRTIKPAKEGKVKPQERENERLPFRTYGVSHGPDQVKQTAPSGPAAPTPGFTFEGVGAGIPGYSVNVAPPDTEGEVGADHYIQWVNSHFLIFDKSGNVVYPTSGAPAPGNTLWTGFSGGGGLCASTNRGELASGS